MVFYSLDDTSHAIVLLVCMLAYAHVYIFIFDCYDL